MRLLSTLILLFWSALTISAESYINEDYGFSIVFPDHFEEEEINEAESTALTATCTYRGMIFIINAIVFDKEFTNDERLEQEANSIVNICDALGSKWKLKKITKWMYGEESGFICPIKGSQKTAKGKVGFFGNFYVIMIGSIQYQLTVLAPKRKMFDGQLERDFAGSLRIL
jgi:hypothetical protein